jgi:hypothetical protein
MLHRILAAAACAAAAGLSLAPAASAAPEPTPPAIPNVFAYIPLNPADYTVNGGKWFAFAGPAGVVCILDSLKGNYGCAGPLPGAPAGVNLVSGGPVGAPAFSTTEQPAYADAGPVRPLPPQTRLTFRSVSCGVDENGVVACLNSRDQVGFVVGPTTTYIGDNKPPPPPPAEPVAPPN